MICIPVTGVWLYTDDNQTMLPVRLCLFVALLSLSILIHNEREGGVHATKLADKYQYLQNDFLASEEGGKFGIDVALNKDGKVGR